MNRFTDLSLRWQLLCAFGLVLLVTAVATGFGLFRLTGAAHDYARLRATTEAASKEADRVNQAFTDRHKVVKNAFLFSNDPQRVQQTASEVAALDRDVQA